MTTDSMPGHEELAAYAHDAWSRWMRYVFGCCTKRSDGAYVIPPSKVERWQRQMDTPYSELSEDEKKSDRLEAYKMAFIMAKYPDCAEITERWGTALEIAAQHLPQNPDAPYPVKSEHLGQAGEHQKVIKSLECFRDTFRGFGRELRALEDHQATPGAEAFTMPMCERCEYLSKAKGENACTAALEVTAMSLPGFTDWAEAIAAAIADAYFGLAAVHLCPRFDRRIEGDESPLEPKSDA